MPPKQKTEKELLRQKNKIEYVFVVGIDLFSRYAFVKLWRVCRNKDKCKRGDLPEIKLDVIKERPDTEVEANAYDIDKADDGKVTQVGANEILDAVKQWYREINKMGFDNIRYFISDDGAEYKGKLDEYLKSKQTIHGTTVPNDKIKNPIAERFIGTLKRLVGQYLAIKGSNDLTQDDMDKIVSFYNDRVHSSTGYAPDEVLKDITMKENDINIESNTAVAPMLFDMYRRQKQEMYLDLISPLPIGSYVRYYTKWKTADKLLSQKKSNIQNWSSTIYKIDELNKKDNHYIISPVGEISPKDKQFEKPQSRGLRREYLLPIDYNAYKKYNIT